MRRLVQGVVITALVLWAPQGALAQWCQQTIKQDVDRALELGRKGRSDQALVLLQSAVTAAVQQGDKRCAAYIELICLYPILQDLNQTDKAVKILYAARDHASGTILETDIEAHLDLHFAEMTQQGPRKHIDDFLSSLSLLSSAKEKLPKIALDDEARLSIESQALTIQINLYRDFFDQFDKALTGKAAQDLPPPWQIFLVSALQDISPQTLDPHPTLRQDHLPLNLLDWLNARRPWTRSLLQVAIELNERVTALDEKRGSNIKGDIKLAEMEVAKDHSQRADLYARLEDLEQAIILKKQALDVFTRFHIFPDTATALDRLIDLYFAQIQAPEASTATSEALKASAKLINLIEQQALALVGQSVGPFLTQYHRAYTRHFYMLNAMYRDVLPHPGEIWLGDQTRVVSQALERLLLHADRMNFRPTRRDLAVYREVGDQIGPYPEVLQRLEQQKQILIERQREVDRAVSEGKEPAAFRPIPGLEVVDPFRRLTEAKRDLVSILEDFKRQQLGSSGIVVPLPRLLEEVRRGMTPSDAIVMYFSDPLLRQPPPKAAIHAAVVTADQSVRLVDVPSSGVEGLQGLIQHMQEQIFLHSPDVRNTLKQMAEVLWHPLGNLPENLTIVLIPDLIGIPFESLPTATGEPLIMHHTIRYAFGLSPDLGTTHRAEAYRSAFVTGAETFPHDGFPPLPFSKEEVESLRSFLHNRGLTVAPSVGLPSVGRPLFMQKDAFDLIHLSTHSGLDPKVPMVDTLAFPNDKLFAYEIALSPVRAKLLVLSACKLFSLRQDRINPVSGITTAALARLAPQVISTLWEVNEAATKIFMLRFYDALVQEREPSAALAVAKRDFLNPLHLQRWMNSASITAPNPSDIQSYEAPDFWAPFVLIVGGQ